MKQLDVIGHGKVAALDGRVLDRDRTISRCVKLKTVTDVEDCAKRYQVTIMDGVCWYIDLHTSLNA